MCPVSTINLRYSQPNKSHSDQREYNPVRVKFTQDSRIRNNDNSTFLIQWSNALFYIHTLFQVFHHRTWPYYILKAQEIYHMFFSSHFLLKMSYTSLYVVYLKVCFNLLTYLSLYNQNYKSFPTLILRIVLDFSSINKTYISVMLSNIR